MSAAVSSHFSGCAARVKAGRRDATTVFLRTPPAASRAARRTTTRTLAADNGNGNGNGQGPVNVGVQVRNTSNRKPIAAPKAETFKISGRTVVITGGSQGIGRATALYFAKKGFNVVIAARDETKCMYAAEDCARVAGRQGAALAVPTDVTDPMSVKRLANEVLARYGTVDVVVSNAGTCLAGPFKDTTLDDFKKQMDVNFYGTVNLAHEFLPVLAMTAQVKNLQKPALVVVNSFGGVVPLKYMTAYSASKYALNGFSECLRMEASQQGIHVGQVHPGVVNSNFLERAEFRGPRADQQRKETQQMLKSPMAQSPEEVAQAVWDCATGYRNEVLVGPLYFSGVTMHRLTGMNPTTFMPEQSPKRQSA